MKKSTIKRAAALAVAGMMTATALAGCGGSSSSGSSKDDSSAAGNAKNGKVYYLNFKPEQDKDCRLLLRSTRTKQVLVTVKAAAEGTCFGQHLQQKWTRTTLLHSSRLTVLSVLQTGKTIVQTSAHQKFIISFFKGLCA